jgi:hypothetical protein
MWDSDVRFIAALLAPADWESRELVVTDREAAICQIRVKPIDA